MLSGDNSILKRTTDAKEKTERQAIIETAQMDIIGKQTENHGRLSADELEEILTVSTYNTQGTLSNEENILERTLTSKDGKYEIPVSEIYNGNLTVESTDIIYFFCGGTENPTRFEAKKGMTFEEWIEEYSPSDFHIVKEFDGRTYVEFGRYCYLHEPNSNAFCTKDSVIVENHNYYTSYERISHLVNRNLHKNISFFSIFAGIVISILY